MHQSISGSSSPEEDRRVALSTSDITVGTAVGVYPRFKLVSENCVFFERTWFIKPLFTCVRMHTHVLYTHIHTYYVHILYTEHPSIHSYIHAYVCYAFVNVCARDAIVLVVHVYRCEHCCCAVLFLPAAPQCPVWLQCSCAPSQHSLAHCLS